jgi:hypothetical protein
MILFSSLKRGGENGGFMATAEGSHNFERLKQHILPLSSSGTFELARREWKLVGIEVSEEWDRCPCGQDIKEHCFIHNNVTGADTHVGNVCINRFIGIDTGTLFDGLKRIAGEKSARANQDLITHAFDLGYLHGTKERDFLMDIRLKRKLTAAQEKWERFIHQRILKKTVVRRRTR